MQEDTHTTHDLEARGRSSDPQGGRPPRPGLLWPVLLAVFWWSLAAPRAEALVAGGLAVLAGLVLYVGLGGRSPHPVRLRGLPAFLPYFLSRMVQGGLDVSRRALHPALPLSPDLVRYRTSLPGGLPRTFFLNTISLLPGTFSARLRGDEIMVHRLDPDIAPVATLRDLEARVGRLFGLRDRPHEDGRGEKIQGRAS